MTKRKTGLPEIALRPEIRAAARRVSELQADRMAMSARYTTQLVKGLLKPEDIDAHIEQLNDLDKQIKSADEKLDDLYADAGIKYSGTSCKTDYNMYTYREIERDALRIFHEREGEATT